MFYVYKITNLLNNKVYVGKTNNPKRRWSRHKQNSKTIDSILYRAIKKHKIFNFMFEIIEENEFEDSSLLREEFWIKELDSTNSQKGYNTLKNSVGINLAGENNPFYGKHHSQESIDMMSVKASMRIGELNHFYGKHHSEETKQDVSDKMSNKNYSHLLGENNNFYGKNHTIESRLKMSKSQRKISEETISSIKELYISGKYTQKELARKFNMYSSTISRIINDKLRKKHEDMP